MRHAREEYHFLKEVLLYLVCLVAPPLSLWLLPNAAGPIAVVCWVIQGRTKHPVFLSLGELLLSVSVFVSIILWLVHLVLTLRGIL